MSHYSSGLDYGTNSVPALMVKAEDSEAVGGTVWNYATGDALALSERYHPGPSPRRPAAVAGAAG